MNLGLVFLFSSTTENPDRFFQGYLFHDADYVFGDKGFEAFCRARGVNRVAGEDGCYIQAEKTDDGFHRFSTDYHGFKKLFYFWDSGFWAVSNSLYQLALHIRRHGYAVEPDESQLAAMTTEGTFYPSGRGSFFSQMTSFDTIIRGVRLVPADCVLWIGPAGVRLENVIHELPDSDYHYQLGHYIDKWIGRLRTLASESSVPIFCDLTGGLDSRAVFGLLLKAIEGNDAVRDKRIQIRCGMSRRARKDHAIANRICRHYGLSLNGRLRRSRRWLNGKTSYALWKDLCLGIYHPIYFPNTFPAGNIVHLGGGGGGKPPSLLRTVPGRACTRSVCCPAGAEHFAPFGTK